MGEISITKLLVVAALVILLFGTKNFVRWAVIWAQRSRALKKP
jgi:Sec-independent protein translocase protein TatA